MSGSVVEPASATPGLSANYHINNPGDPNDQKGLTGVAVVDSATGLAASIDVGVDAGGTNAGTQAGSTTPGVGIRGWLSTIAGIFQNGLAKIQGNVASLSADSGNPVKIGGVYNAGAPSPSSGQRVDLQVDAKGALYVNNGYLLAGAAGVGDNVAVQSLTATAALSFTSPSSVGTVAQTPVTALGPYRTCFLYAALQGGAGGTLDIYIQVSPDGGTTWVDWGHFAQLAAGAGQIFRALTFSKTNQQTTLQTVGTGTSPALAASTFIGGDWGDRMRIVAVAGSGTTAGTAQTILLTFTS